MRPSRSFLCRSAGKRACLADRRACLADRRACLADKRVHLADGRVPLAGRRASVLILVAWVLSLLAVSLGTTARHQLLFSQRLIQDATLRRACEAGLNRARTFLARRQDGAPEEEEEPVRPWLEREDLFKDISIGPAVFSLGYTLGGPISCESRFFYGLADEEAKVNLNTAAQDVLVRLFEVVLGVGPPQAQELADAVVDWRDSDAAAQPKGAEDDFYEGLPAPYSCKDASFESPDELLLVRGFDVTIYENIKGYVTVFGGGRLNINTVSAEVLEALGLETGLVGKIDRYRRGPDARWGTLDDGVFASAERIAEDIVGLTDPEKLSLEQLAAQAFTVTSSYFSATCAAQMAGRGGSFSVTAVFERTFAEEGYEVGPRYWRTSP